MKHTNKYLAAVICGILAIGAAAALAGCDDEEKPSVSENEPSVSVSASEDQSADMPESSADKASEESKDETVKASVGDTVTTKDMKLTMTKAFTAQTLKGDGEYALEDKADSGKVYLILEYEAENISDEKISISTYNFDVSVDGYTVDTTILVNNPDGLKLFSGDMMPGKKMAGYAVYEVPADWKECEAAYSEILSSGSEFVFVLNSSDVSAAS